MSSSNGLPCSRKIGGSDCQCTNEEELDDDECPECGHLPKYHTSCAKRNSFDSTARIKMGVTINSRERTVEKVYNMMKNFPMVQIRGTPASGKTTLLRLLSVFIKFYHPGTIVRIFTQWPKAGQKDGPPIELQDWEEWLVRQLDVAENRLYNPKLPIVILIDEGQDCYHDRVLWNYFIKTRIQTLRNIRVVVACCYGSISEGAEMDIVKLTTSPDFIHPNQIVQLYASGERPGVFFTEPEFEEVVEAFRDNKVLQLMPKFQRSLFYLTGGHCSATFDLLQHIFTSSDAKQAMLNGHDLRLLDAREMDNLETIIKVSNFGRRLPRSLATIHQDNVRTVLRKICVEGQLSIGYYDYNTKLGKAVRHCEEKGWITREMSRASHNSFFTFPTGLHHWYFSYRFFKSAPALDPKLKLQDLVFKALHRLNCNRLKISESVRGSATLNPGGVMNYHVTPEAVYQNEVYQIIWEESEGAVAAAPEVFVGQGNRPGPGQRGRLDFLNKSRELWAIEALTNESDLVEHYERFVGNGGYVTAGLDDFILLNFTKSSPKRSYPNVSKTYHVVFDADFVKATVYDASNCVKLFQFLLTA